MSTPAPIDFFSHSLSEMEDWFAARGHPRYRARQLFRNVYRRGVDDLERMTDLPLPLRRELGPLVNLRPLQQVASRVSEDGTATKVLWRLADGKEIESVLMHADYGDTICFSTQVGCAFRCSFCITAKLGRLRQLTPGEIVAQAQALAHARPRGPGFNLVAMGMGEPMDNLDALLRAAEILGDPHGLNLSGKRITVSTVGVVPGIRRLARERPDLRLAISLNATTDEVRGGIMPVTRKYPIASLVEALVDFAAHTRDRITVEYVLIRGLNDTPEDADRLGRIAEKFPSKLNLIPFNPSPLFAYERPTPEEVDAFARRLWAFRTTVTVRYSKGVDIQAACGQLGYDQVLRAETPAAAG